MKWTWMVGNWPLRRVRSCYFTLSVTNSRRLYRWSDLSTTTYTPFPVSP